MTAADILSAPAGSPYDRGDSDAYYQRPNPRPHKWADPLGAQRIDDLTPAEIADYWRGHDENPSGKKDW
jgi:hypothetical protein